MPNAENADFVGDPETLAQQLVDMAYTVLNADDKELVEQHRLTFQMPFPVGVEGITKIQEGEEVFRRVRDKGKRSEAEVNVVQRSEKPVTDLVTFDVRPIYDKESGTTKAVIG